MRVSDRRTAAAAPGMHSMGRRRCREDTGACAAGARVVSSHVTSDGVVVYVRCGCGGVRMAYCPLVDRGVAADRHRASNGGLVMTGRRSDVAQGRP